MCSMYKTHTKYPENSFMTSKMIVSLFMSSDSFSDRFCCYLSTITDDFEFDDFEIEPDINES